MLKSFSSTPYSRELAFSINKTGMEAKEGPVGCRTKDASGSTHLERWMGGPCPHLPPLPHPHRLLSSSCWSLERPFSTIFRASSTSILCSSFSTSMLAFPFVSRSSHRIYSFHSAPDERKVWRVFVMGVGFHRDLRLVLGHIVASGCRRGLRSIRQRLEG